ncbi:MAG: hypothetical protein V4573_11675 [Pseudomonadota bacterium]
MNRSPELTPKERLAASRKALLRSMNHAESGDNAGSDGSATDGLAGFGEAPEGGGAWAKIKRTAGVWWQHHPAHLALDLAKPALSRYAEEKPLQLLGIAAGIGAAAVVIRPWRLISVTGLLFAALKASDAPVLLMSILSSGHEPTTTKKDSP